MLDVDKLKEEDLDRIVESLRRHNIQMRNLMDDPNKIINQNYSSLAVHLRALLCDADIPILIIAAKYVGLTLPIVGGCGDFLKGMPEGMILLYDFVGCHWDSTRQGLAVPIEEFLTYPIGFDQGNVNGERVSQSYNPTQIIKWVANKDGAAHLALNEPDLYKSVKGLIFHSNGIDNKNFISQRLIYQLSRWTIIASTYILGLSRLEECLYKELDILKDVDRIDVNSLHLEEHYSFYKDGSDYFEGEHFCKHNVKIDISRGFQLHSMINITTQLNSGENTIFEASLESENIPKIMVCINNKDLLFRALLKHNLLVTNKIENFTDTEYFDRYIYMSYELKVLDDKVKSEVWINGKLINSSDINGEIDGVLSQVVFSGTIEEKNSATFFMRECMIISGNITDDERSGIAKYLWCDLINENYVDNLLVALKDGQLERFLASFEEARIKTNKRD